MSYAWIDDPVPEGIGKASDEVIHALLSRFAVCTLRENGTLFTIETPDLRRVAFTWAPKPVHQIQAFEEVARLLVWNCCGYHGIYKPSLAEVLPQLPTDTEANAFYMDYDHIDIHKSGTYQRATAVLVKATIVPIYINNATTPAT